MTRPNPHFALTRIVAIAALLLGSLAHGQAPAVDDPPVRVGRLSFISGQVSFSPAGNDEWVQARINRPVITGDQLWADDNARAELTIDNSSWWLGEQTSVTVANLDDRIAQFQVQQGTLEFRVLRMPPGNIIEVDTPNLAVTVTRTGQYRVVVDPRDGATAVYVRSGRADVYGENASYALAPGQGYRFYGTDLADSELAYNTPPETFDRFVVERSRRYERNVSVRYVSPEVVGYEDLDSYGAWTVEASYGNVWFPRTVRAGWAPYREGHWAWIDPWGWTWVDDAPWGFAPFHYGRWAHFDRGWGWIPGPRTVRPVYAPALVAFVGGAGFSVSVSSGPAIGWFPLGPRDVYRPPYRVSQDYFRQVNVSNTVINQTNITTVYNDYRTNTVARTEYVNMRVPNAVTAVPPAAFAQSQSVGRAVVALPAAAIASAQVQAVARVAPARPAMLGAAPVAQTRPPAATAQRSVVARAAPPPPPVRYAQKLQALEKNPGQPLSNRELQQLRANGAAPAGAAPARPVMVIEQTKPPAANATPPARAAGDAAARRSRGGAPDAQTPATAAGAPANATPGGTPAAPQRDVRRGVPNTPDAPTGPASNSPPGRPAPAADAERPNLRQQQQERANPARGAAGSPNAAAEPSANPPPSPGARPPVTPGSVERAVPGRPEGRSEPTPPAAVTPPQATPPQATPRPDPRQQQRDRANEAPQQQQQGRANEARQQQQRQDRANEARQQQQQRANEARQAAPPQAAPQPTAPSPQERAAPRAPEAQVPRPSEARPEPPRPPDARPARPVAAPPAPPRPEAAPQPPARPPEAQGNPGRGRGRGNDTKDDK
ncbi:MAG: DUF6600 domain-containing protein, partial [Betaproteobacteria bacterium]